MPDLPSPYHVGIVVADLAAARERLRAVLGVTWGPVLHLDEVGYRDGGGTDLVLPTTLCYSTGDLGIELIEEVPGTIWERNEHSNLHHVGFWTERLGADGRAMAVAGCPMQLCGRDGEAAPVSFAYHGDEDLGIRIELVDSSMRDAMAFLFRPDPTAT